MKAEITVTMKINFTGQHITAAVCTSALLILNFETVWTVHKKHRIPKAKEQENGNDPTVSSVRKLAGTEELATC